MATGALRLLIEGIDAGDEAAVLDRLAASPEAATAALDVGATRAAAAEHYLTAIAHYVYAGDTALHAAAAAHRPAIARALVAAGGSVAARNRRGATPLHYAADGNPNRAGWDPEAQAATIAFLIEAGADADAVDKNGVGALHRAVRCRCAAAVAALLEGGADPQQENGSGSTPAMLARRETGRGGAGSPAAKRERDVILRLLQRHGANG